MVFRIFGQPIVNYMEELFLYIWRFLGGRRRAVCGTVFWFRRLCPREDEEEDFVGSRETVFDISDVVNRGPWTIMWNMLCGRGASHQ